MLVLSNLENPDGVIGQNEPFKYDVAFDDVLFEHFVDLAALDERAEFVQFPVGDDGFVNYALFEFVVCHHFVRIDFNELEHSHQFTAIMAQFLCHFKNLLFTLILFIDSGFRLLKY